MRKVLILIALTAVAFSGCGLLGGGEEANTNSNAAVSDDPNEVPKYETAEQAIEKGDEFLDTSLYKKAIAAFRQAVELNQNLGEAHFKLGIAYALQEDLEQLPPGVEGNSDKAFKNAVTVYKKYVKEKPDDAEAWFNLGRAQGRLFEDKESADSLGKAVKLDEENGLYRTEYGSALIKLARYGEAIRQLDKALELDEDNLRAEDLLEKAQAGKKRVDFKPPDKSNSNTNADEGEGEPGSGTSDSNTSQQGRSPGQPKPPPPPPQPAPPKNPPPGNR